MHMDNAHPRTPASAPADGPRPDYVREAVADLEALFTYLRIAKLERDYFAHPASFNPPPIDATKDADHD
jgi:hypothetical protein